LSVFSLLPSPAPCFRYFSFPNFSISVFPLLLKLLAPRRAGRNLDREAQLMSRNEEPDRRPASEILKRGKYATDGELELKPPDVLKAPPISPTNPVARASLPASSGNVSLPGTWGGTPPSIRSREGCATRRIQPSIDKHKSIPSDQYEYSH
jgi:hypothetical protein